MRNVKKVNTNDIIQLPPLVLILATFIIGGFAGFITYAQTHKEISTYIAFLKWSNSGLISLAFFFMFFDYLKNHLPLLLSLSLILGMMGKDGQTLLFSIARRFKLPKDIFEEDKDDNNETP